MMLAMIEPAATLIDILRALADPTRLRIMRLLTRMELAVGELAQVLDQGGGRLGHRQHHIKNSLYDATGHAVYGKMPHR